MVKIEESGRAWLKSFDERAAQFMNEMIAELEALREKVNPKKAFRFEDTQTGTTGFIKAESAGKARARLARDAKDAGYQTRIIEIKVWRHLAFDNITPNPGPYINDWDI